MNPFTQPSPNNENIIKSLKETRAYHAFHKKKKHALHTAKTMLDCKTIHINHLRQKITAQKKQVRTLCTNKKKPWHIGAVHDSCLHLIRFI